VQFLFAYPLTLEAANVTLLNGLIDTNAFSRFQSNAIELLKDDA
jgi:hypothetical protein